VVWRVSAKSRTPQELGGRTLIVWRRPRPTIRGICNHCVSPEAREVETFWRIGRSNSNLVRREVFPGAAGAFIRSGESGAELVIGQWGWVPWFAKTVKVTYSTNNARFEGIANKASFKQV
jgi:putative SOS response-associated peptidase YedK